MDDDTISQQVNTLYSKIYELFHQRWENKKKMPSLEANAIIFHLLNSGPLTIKEAARHFNRSLSAMSEILTRMIGQGWIEKISDPRDKRIKYVWPTIEGEAILLKSSNVLDQNKLAQALSKLEQQTKDKLINNLTLLIGAINEM